jgi:hypothetical protein
MLVAGKLATRVISPANEISVLNFESSSGEDFLAKS